MLQFEHVECRRGVAQVPKLNCAVGTGREKESVLREVRNLLDIIAMRIVYSDDRVLFENVKDLYTRVISSDNELLVIFEF